MCVMMFIFNTAFYMYMHKCTYIMYICILPPHLDIHLVTYQVTILSHAPHTINNPI